MNDEYGRVLGKLEEGVDWLKDEVSGLRTDVQKLNEFKWRVAGGAALLSVILTAVIEIFHSKGN